MAPEFLPPHPPPRRAWSAFCSEATGVRSHTPSYQRGPFLAQFMDARYYICTILFLLNYGSEDLVKQQFDAERWSERGPGGSDKQPNLRAAATGGRRATRRLRPRL